MAKDRGKRKEAGERSTTELSRQIGRERTSETEASRTIKQEKGSKEKGAGSTKREKKGEGARKVELREDARWKEQA